MKLNQRFLLVAVLLVGLVAVMGSCASSRQMGCPSKITQSQTIQDHHC